MKLFSALLFAAFCGLCVGSSVSPTLDDAKTRENKFLEDRDTDKACVLPPKLPGSSALAGGLCLNDRLEINDLPTNRKQSYEIVDIDSLPKNFFWGDIHGVNYLTASRNQHIPQYCGSCWAFGTLSAVMDRIKIQRRNQDPEVVLAPQVLINCGSGSCNGGSDSGVYSYLRHYGIPDETCQNYVARNENCKSDSVCQKCDWTSSRNICAEVKDYRSFFISGSGYLSARSNFEKNRAKISTVNNIKAEIYARGPVACTIYATDLFDDYTGGIFSQEGDWLYSNHIVSLVGWGEEDGIEYWIGRNSWGTYWGENGFFRIRRPAQKYGLGVDNSCSFADPIIPENLLPEDLLPEDVPYAEYLLNYHAKEAKPEAEPFKDRSEFIGNAADAYDIRNIDGKSYASIDRNQNSPKFCESSWAQAAISALNDRFALLRPDAFPEVSLSVQVLLNCVNPPQTLNTENLFFPFHYSKRERTKHDEPTKETIEELPRGCDGGSPANAYAFIKESSIPDESCAPYEAEPRQCNEIQTCKCCWPTECYSMAPGEYTPYTISDFGQISGDDAVKEEITQNGPLACRICDSKSFSSYEGGIYSDETACENESVEKYVVLSGWGEENGVPYWIGRNSWGVYWGEDGWFKLAMGEGDLGITKECHWATPAQPEYRALYETDEGPVRRE